jgi:hypothetical protein
MAERNKPNASDEQKATVYKTKARHYPQYKLIGLNSPTKIDFTVSAKGVSSPTYHNFPPMDIEYKITVHFATTRPGYIEFRKTAVGNEKTYTDHVNIGVTDSDILAELSAKSHKDAFAEAADLIINGLTNRSIPTSKVPNNPEEQAQLENLNLLQMNEEKRIINHMRTLSSGVALTHLLRY